MRQIEEKPLTDTSSAWYQAFFTEDYLKLYETWFDHERTAAEVSFVETALGLPPDASILDLCCGQGRHAVALAQRGYRVTGQDLSQDYLDLAGKHAAASKVTLDLVQSDMRIIPFEAAFDAVINMFTAFGYLESEEEDQKVLAAVQRALKPGGWLLLDMLNREWVVTNQVEKDWHLGPDGAVYLEQRNLDLLASKNHVTFHSLDKEGLLRDLGGHHIRLYTLTEMAAQINKAGLTFIRVYGGYTSEPYGVSSRRMIVVARKPAA